ncbi:ATP-binding protein [Sulfitobacter sp. PS-8MA]|uniref:ATP-binding protein n=1 Tax=Sulfitobacter sp. PS-8MA TaxID=3237707 RepID=UPI0034C6BDCE
MPDPSAGPPPLISFAFSVQSSDLATREALRRVLEGLRPLALEAEVASTVELVLAEVLNNIVEHAYPDPKAPGPIHVACRHAGDGLHFQLRDSGLPMPGGQAPLGMAQSVDTDAADLPEGGFGWFLIRDLAEDLTYRRVAQENQLDLHLAVPRPSQTRRSGAARPE